MISLPNGALVSIAATYGVAKAMSAISNASPGVATLVTGHGVVAEDFLEVTSGWSRITDKIIKAGFLGSPPGNDVPLVGIDTSLTSIYPAAGGAGSVRKILTWTQLSQILT